MKSFPNIEHKPFPGQSYRVGYGDGVWHIHKITYCGKPAYRCEHLKTGKKFLWRTLEIVSESLSEFAATGVPT